MAVEPLKIGVIREGKVPPDSRVALPPSLASEVASYPDVDLVVQPSPGRCFPDEAYREAGVRLQEDMSDRDVLLGVKEVPIHQLLAGKTYFFFSHTHKRQAYNRGLLQAILDRKVRMIDYELLTASEGGKRLIAFGRFAGMVGAHHGLRAWGLRTGAYDLPQMNTFLDYGEAKAAYAKTSWGDVRAVVTGTGRVGKGAAEVLRDAGFAELDPDAFLAGEGTGPVFTALGVKRYVRRRDHAAFEKKDFYADPTGFETRFLPYCEVADVVVHGIFWDNRAPAMFETADMRRPGFRVSVIADVTCDIFPVTSMPPTRKASTIADPYFGFDPRSEEIIEKAFGKDVVTMMTVDNLPNELPRDASKSFGTMFINKILPELRKDESAILARATIAEGGELTPRYRHLSDFVAGAA